MGREPSAISPYYAHRLSSPNYAVASPMSTFSSPPLFFLYLTPERRRASLSRCTGTLCPAMPVSSRANKREKGEGRVYPVKSMRARTAKLGSYWTFDSLLIGSYLRGKGGGPTSVGYRSGLPQSSLAHDTPASTSRPCRYVPNPKCAHISRFKPSSS